MNFSAHKIAGFDLCHGILDLIPLGAMIIDRDFRVVFWNKFLEGWTGRTQADMLAQDIRELCPHLAGGANATRLEEIFKGGSPLIFSSYLHKQMIPCKTPSGADRLQHTTVLSLRDNGTRGFLALFIIQDVTEVHSRLGEYAKMRNLAMQELAERNRAEQALVKGHREQSILYSISSKASESLDLEIILRHTRDVLSEEFDKSAVGIYLLAADGRTLNLECWQGVDESLALKTSRLELDNSLVGLAVSTGKPQFRYFSEHLKVGKARFLYEDGFRSLAAFPIIAQGDILGAVAVLFRDVRTFDDDEFKLFESIGAQLGLAVKNAQLFESVSRELARRVKAEGYAKSILDSLSAAVAVIDHDGVVIDTNSAWKQKALEGGLGDNFGAGQNYLAVCDNAEGTFADGSHEAAAGIRKVISGEIKEFCQTYEFTPPGKQHWFNLRVTRVAESAPPQVVLTHEDVTELKLSEEAMRLLSQRDGLTGLANRRYFDEVLCREWVRAKRNMRPLSFIMADIDHFKAYNDCYGHLLGDECIKMVAKALQRTLKRPTDLAVRYGGEEFGGLMPETDLNGARLMAETFRQAVLAEGMHHMLSTSTPVVSLSLGVASLVPDRDSDPKKLIELADSALYRAKQSGRNRICLAKI